MQYVVYSGGLDSYTLLNTVLRSHIPSEVVALNFYYGQRHAKEQQYAERACEELGVRLISIDISPIVAAMDASSSLVSDAPVPEGHYEAESMKSTIVPGRNTIMLSIAMGIAEADYIRRLADVGGDRCAISPNTVYYGAHSGDHHIYPDCRPVYIGRMADLFYFATEDGVMLSAPFARLSKGAIVEQGLNLGLDYSKTWTCYKGEEEPCGECGACRERAEAFAHNDADDPLLARAAE